MSRRPQGLSLSELAQLHRDGDSALSAGDAPHFLIVERLEDLQDHETLALTRDLVTSGASDPSTARVFAVVGEQPPCIHLGRSSDADLWLDDPTVSKLHLRFRRHGQAMTVSDLGSQNGTKLNGTRLHPGQEAPLRPGDVLDISERYRATFVSAETLLARLDRVSSEKTASGSRSGSGILAGKVAVITGGGRGLGRAYALRFAEEGCRVVVNDIGAAPCGLGADASVAPSVVAEIERAGGTAIASLHDVASRAEVDALFELARQRFGGVDILVCSAGALHVGSSVLELDDAIWDRLMAVNARGTLLCVQAAARSMIEQRRPGRVITTSSMVALSSNPGMSGYAASKAAVYALSQTAALELAAHHITVNTLMPMAWTRLTAGVPAIAAIPNVEEVLSTSHVADIALFLASDLAGGITGQVVDIGGTQLSSYRTKQSAPVLPSSARWTPQELRRRWPEFTRLWQAD